jgi:hypothetical protein
MGSSGKAKETTAFTAEHAESAEKGASPGNGNDEHNALKKEPQRDKGLRTKERRHKAVLPQKSLFNGALRALLLENRIKSIRSLRLRRTLTMTHHNT